MVQPPDPFPEGQGAEAASLAPVRYLPWDSEHFGFRIGRYESPTMSPLDARDALERSRALQLRCLYYLAAGHDPQSSAVAQSAGFRVRDVRITLENHHPAAGRFPAVADLVVRRAIPEDLPNLEEQARSGFTTTRFYADPHFPHDKCGDLYAAWVARDYQTNPGGLLVAQLGGHTAGFVSTRWHGTEPAEISLIVVGNEYRSHGIGGALVGATLAHLCERGAETVAVVTQATNVAALSMYERAGFRVRGVDLWFHRWFRGPKRAR